MSFTYRPNDDEAAVAATLARRRNRIHGDGSNLPVGKGEDPSDYARFVQNYRAALAEITVTHIVDRHWSGCGKRLRDVGDYYEVRSITKRGYGLLVRPKDPDPAPCVLVLVEETRVCTALGWAFISEVKSKGQIFDQDTDKPYWVLYEPQLRSMETIREALEI